MARHGVARALDSKFRLTFAQSPGKVCCVFHNLLCMINRHRPTRNKVRHRGTTYISVCRYCHHDIERRRSKVWVLRKDV